MKLNTQKIMRQNQNPDDDSQVMDAPRGLSPDFNKIEDERAL